MCEVDVLDHHRFCDEFSHLVHRRSTVTKTLSRSLKSMEEKFETIKTFCLSVTFIMQLSIMVNFSSV